jgi:hypothetical protein
MWNCFLNDVRVSNSCVLKIFFRRYGVVPGVHPRPEVFRADFSLPPAVRHSKLKEKSIGPPKLYLGGHLSLVELDNGVKACAFNSSQYVRTAVQNVEDLIAKDENKRWKHPNKAETPLCTSYRPELDVTPELRCDWCHVS